MLILGLVLIYLYSLGFLGATRGAILTPTIVLIFSAFGLSYPISNGTLTTK
jgi:hypothetical protein